MDVIYHLFCIYIVYIMLVIQIEGFKGQEEWQLKYMKKNTNSWEFQTCCSTPMEAEDACAKRGPVLERS